MMRLPPWNLLWAKHGPIRPRQARRPILVGEAKCARKGHRPVNRYGYCSRCGWFNAPASAVEAAP